MIRVAIHCELAQNTGVARYARSLLTELGKLSSEVAVRALTYPLRPERPDWLPETVGYRRALIPGRLQRAYVENIGIAVDRFVGRRSGELVHLTSTTGWQPTAPVVLTVYDLAWRIYGKEYEGVMPPFAIRQIESAIARADHIVSISRTTTEALIEAGIPERRITTTLLGVDPVFFRTARTSDRSGLTRLGIDKPYVLYIGSINVRKGTATLVEAMHRLASERDVDLVIAGPIPPEGLEAWNLVNPWTKHLGYVGEQELLDLYAGASAVAVPARLEGFGLPLIEAMAAGAPAVASDIPVFREIGGGVAVLTESGYIEEFYRALKRVFDDTAFAQELGERGREHARRFNWQTCAEATLDAYRIVLRR